LTYWKAFQTRYQRAKDSKTQSATTVTRESWIDPLLERLNYKLAFQRQALQAGGETFAISHRAGDDEAAPPVHVVGFDENIDRREKGRRSPQATVQEYLNRSNVVWGIVTNGRHLRVLRKSPQISKPSYLQFDLEGMIEAGLYSDSVLLYRLLHRSRLPRSGADAHDCLLEEYWRRCEEEGARVQEGLRENVYKALETFGTAFLTHPDCAELREAIKSGQLSSGTYYRELLRLVYRLLFLMVAEERRLIFPAPPEEGHNAAPHCDETLERQRVYAEHYSVLQLRRRAEGMLLQDRHGDLWESLKTTFSVFRSESLAALLGMAALNGELFGPRGCEHIERASCFNIDVLLSIRALSTLEGGGRVNFGGLNVEELGSIYESLLDYDPQIILSDQPHFELVAGSERKTTGSYYTHPELVGELIKSALEPVVAERLAARSTKDEKERALLSLRVIDPAAGSGHFLLAAARHMGRELARIRTAEEEPSPEAYRRAVRDVIRECTYAVDKNPLAVDLCKVALWIEGHNAGMPLSFLDHHIKCGDSLVGVFDPKVVEEGIPDDTYKPVEGDDKAAAKHYRTLNRETKKNLPTIPQFKLPGDVVAALEMLSRRDERTPEDVAAKEREYAALVNSPAMQNLEQACNAWTAAFFVPLRMPELRGRDLVPTSGTVWERLSGRQIYGPLDGEITKAKVAYSFFHWPVEFPDVFTRGGFDVVLGNPPWERIKLQEKEFFASRASEVARAPNKAAREKLIKELPKRKPELAAEWALAVHGAEAQSKFVRASERFPLCGRGDVNTYSIFAELARALTGKAGRAGIIVPSGIATDDTTKFFFRDLMESHSLASLYDFENRKKLFPAVDSRMKFSLLTLTSKDGAKRAEFVFFAQNADELRDPERRISLSAQDIALLNPNTRTCPIFRTRRDAEITKGIYRRVPVLIKEGPPEENPWGIKFATMFHMSNDSHLFRTREQLERDGWTLKGNIFRNGRERCLPLYEAKMIQPYNHRAASVEVDASRKFRQGQPVESGTTELRNPRYFPEPHYYVVESAISKALPEGFGRGWLLGWRDVTSVTNGRTLLATAIPLAAVGDKFLLVFSIKPPSLVLSMLGNLNAFIADYLVRQKLGGTSLKYFVLRQIPIFSPLMLSGEVPWSNREQLSTWLSIRIMELCYTAWDLRPLAIALDQHCPPFLWDEERRFMIRCELDAAFFHLYGISRDDVDYIIDTFQIVKRKDQERLGEYRTKRVILEIYDEMEQAKQTGKSYQTRLDPPPGDPRAAHREGLSKRESADVV
jgi:Eco57I restriction-modification methylase